MKREGLKTLKEMCQKDQKFVDFIKELSVVENAVELLGGRSRSEGRREEKGGTVWKELRVKEKIGLLGLLTALVKSGIEFPDEEERKEI